MKFWKAEHNADDLYFSCQSKVRVAVLLFAFKNVRNRDGISCKSECVSCQPFTLNLGRLMSSPTWHQYEYDADHWKRHGCSDHAFELLSSNTQG